MTLLNNKEIQPEPLLVGVDVGSTTAKVTVMRANSHEVLVRHYARHHAQQAKCLAQLLETIREELREKGLDQAPLRCALCGSGGASLAHALGLPYVQEVVANSLAISAFYPTARTAIELGGQDAKMIFFAFDHAHNELNVSDMRMNGSCAGGTGAFIDEIASLLKVPIEQFNDLASKGSALHNVSGRCGVYAKTDIQPLLNQGVPKEDIALSSFHAIAKQTIGGLAQGLEIKAPIIFEGGPLTFNPRLIKVFAERLELGRGDIIIPEHPETIVAVGAALSLEGLFAQEEASLALDDAIQTLSSDNIVVIDSLSEGASHTGGHVSKPFFSNDEERQAFKKRHALPEWKSALEKAQESGASRANGAGETGSNGVTAGSNGSTAGANGAGRALPATLPSTLRVYLGVDCGSTTTKFALLNESGELIDSFYAPNEGEPVEVGMNALRALHDKYQQAGCNLEILACGTTGYGEMLFATALGADYHVVETVAHAHAVQHFEPETSFILDIGGQDMKAIWLEGDIITNVVVNEACSSGCGSFLESFASTLNIDTKDIAEAAFRSTNPADLGSRCTVFMNSSIVTEQKNGKNPDDIMAGLCRSIIENVFTKVIRISNVDKLGSNIVVQGGTFLNDAVLCAFEQYVGKEVVRAPYPGLMGAIGVALLAKEHCQVAPNEVSEENAQTAGQAQSEGESGAPLQGSAQPGAQPQPGTQPGSQPTAHTHPTSSFVGWDAVQNFSYTQESNLICPFCANRCNRTRITFSNGSSWITGNRCSKGEIVGDPKDATIREQVRAAKEASERVPNMFKDRERLLFQDWDFKPVCPANNITLGLPRVLSNWDYYPFWKTLLSALGFTVKLSHNSSRAIYENGLSAVTSDTVCFPAKLVHGHLRDLHKQGVDRIFMPIVTTVPSENTSKDSQSMCAVVKGYPLVIQNSDNPTRRWDIPFDNPLFHWFDESDCLLQLQMYFQATFEIDKNATAKALKQALKNQRTFQAELKKRGAEIIEQACQTNSYAVVLAGRPYHNDTLVNHDLPFMFTSRGIPVLTADAVPGSEEVDLSNSLIDIVNNFHARMLSTSVLAAQSPNLEYVQIVSFGCGHDAYLSDEITRLMREISQGEKTPLILKVDESDIEGPLGIRVRSFIETVNERHAKLGTSYTSYGLGNGGATAGASTASTASTASANAPTSTSSAGSSLSYDAPTEGVFLSRGATKTNGGTSLPPANPQLADPYPQKFTKQDCKDLTVLIPNTSKAFSLLMATVFANQGLKTESLPIGRERAIYLGKRYVHNDICFPAQIVIGETLEALESGKYDLDRVAVSTGKYIGDCRLTHYAALLRKALDDAGYSKIPIITNDDVDFHNIHPGFKMNIKSAIQIAIGLPMIDALEEILRKIRPYEITPHSADNAFTKAINSMMDGLRNSGISGMKKGFKHAIEIMRDVKYDRSNPKPTVLIVGEYLLNFHPGANHDMEEYLENNGLEVIEARMTDVIRKTYFYQKAQVKEFGVHRDFGKKVSNSISDSFFTLAHNITDKIAHMHPLYTPPVRMPELVQDSDPIIHHTFDAGEGVLIPAEIIHHAKNGCRNFIILQPFGCLPNHVVGRGISKRLKELYPDAQILPLDYDPDVSFANIENRLQMLIMNAKQI